MSEDQARAKGAQEFYTVEQLADAWRCSSKKVRRLIGKGELIAHKFGAQIRVSHADKTTYERVNRMG